MEDSNSKTNKQKRLLQNIMKQNENFSKGLKKLKGDFLKSFTKQPNLRELIKIKGTNTKGEDIIADAVMM